MFSGKVIIIGAGCGDPELLTLKAAKYLQQAEIILVDRLVNESLLGSYANANAKIIFVGKQALQSHSISQKKINELLVNYAAQYKLVVRLKGGDISIFGNLVEELETLKANNIAYELIPGISAAIGAAAYTGIPLTARGHATGIRILTYYEKEILSAIQIKELAQTNDTLIFYMCKKNIGSLIQQMAQQTQETKKKVAIISQASTPFQEVSIYTLHEYEKIIHAHEWVSPSLVIIGSVVTLYEKYKWFPEINPQIIKNYFKQIESSSV